MNVTELLATTARWFESKGIETEPIVHAAQERDRFRALALRRGGHEPVAYILGEREFYSRPFAVDPRVLIPRPDTEILVEAALAQIEPEAEGVLLDYGTGSGALALTLVLERPGLRALALDCSKDALDVARANAEALRVTDRVGFVGSDGLRRLPARFSGGLCAIVANPPYIPLDQREGLAPDVRDHEPELALFPGQDPLLHYRHLSQEAGPWLETGGFLALEIGIGQADAVEALLAQAGWRDIDRKRDLAGIDRVLLARKPDGLQA